MSYEYAIVVINKTRLETLVERFNTKKQASFYIEKQGLNFSSYEHEHEVFHEGLLSLQTQLSKVIKNKIVDRKYLPSFQFAGNQLIVVIGQDGLVANTAKYAKGCPIVAVNPDKSLYDGVLLPFSPGDFIGGVEKVMSGQFASKTVRFAQATLNDGQRLLAFNDLFIGADSHVSARYRITYNQVTEEQSSSGLIVSTQSGSTGWLSSIFNMAYGVASLFETGLQPKQPTLGSDQLLFAVREPFRSVKTQTNIVAGMLQPTTILKIESLMPNNGVIFSDGIQADFLKFNSGAVASIGFAPETGTLVLK